VRQLPITSSDPVLGDRGAPVRVVVFSSFQCPACKSISMVIHDIAHAYNRKVEVIFKHFPLGKECNPAVQQELQPRACAAAYAAEAARLQDAFWKYHDGLFSSSLAASEEILAGIAKSSKLDLARWESDRNSPAVKNKVLADANLGVVLKLEGTPSIYINGRRMKRINRAALELVISRELAKESGTQAAALRLPSPLAQ
jgi:protein-disulfide isomerase